MTRKDKVMVAVGIAAYLWMLIIAFWDTVMLTFLLILVFIIAVGRYGTPFDELD